MQEITKIIALSDTHNGKIPSIVSAYLKNADYLLHVGDIASLSAYNELIELALLTKNKLKGLIVAKGSEDNDPSLPALKDKNVITVGGISIGLMHDVLNSQVGSPYFTSATNIANGYSGEWNEWGLANGVNVLVFGHIRYPIIANGKNLLICPGHSSSSYPTDDCGSVPTMAQLIIKEGFVHAAIVPLDGSLRNNEHFAKFWPHQSE